MMRKKDEGVLTVMDALIFTVVLLIATFLILNILHDSIVRTQDLRMSEVKEEAVSDIHETVISKEIESSYIIDDSKIEKTLPVPRWIKNLLFLKYQDGNNSRGKYELSRMKDDIKEVYRRCAWDISRYHFAVHSEYKDVDVFLSDECDIYSELPYERAANSYITTFDPNDEIGGYGEEKLEIILYIWR